MDHFALRNIFENMFAQMDENATLTESLSAKLSESEETVSNLENALLMKENDMHSAATELSDTVQRLVAENNQVNSELQRARDKIATLESTHAAGISSSIEEA